MPFDDRLFPFERVLVGRLFDRVDVLPVERVLPDDRFEVGRFEVDRLLLPLLLEREGRLLLELGRRVLLERDGRFVFELGRRVLLLELGRRVLLERDGRFVLLEGRWLEGRVRFERELDGRRVFVVDGRREFGVFERVLRELFDRPRLLEEPRVFCGCALERLLPRVE